MAYRGARHADRDIDGRRIAVAVREKAKKQVRIQEALSLATQIGLPSWVSVDADKLEGVFKNMPDRSELTGDINEQLVVEFYSK